LNQKKVSDLKEIAKSLSLKGYSKYNKADLIIFIKLKSSSVKLKSPFEIEITELLHLPDEIYGEICKHSSIKDLKNLIITNKVLKNQCERILYEKLNKLKISAGGSHSLALDEDGNIYSCGLNEDGQLGLGNNKGKNKFIKLINLLILV